jgi:hypothetical protein
MKFVDSIEVLGLRQDHEVGVAARPDERKRPQQVTFRKVLAGGDELPLVLGPLLVLEPTPGGINL